MAHTGYNSVVSALCLLFIGSLPCESKTCSQRAINDCTENSNGYYCPYFKNVSTCLEDLKETCTSDVLIEVITRVLADHRDMAEECPGLPDGECFFSSLQLCQGEVPVNVRFQTNLSLKDEQKACNEFKGKPDRVKACVRRLGTACTSDRAKQEIEQSIQVIEDIERKCSKIEESN